MPVPFTGAVGLGGRRSSPDREPPGASNAPTGAPNVLVVLHDDAGCAAWSPYGGWIEMPTMERLARNGLIYSQWHTTSADSPTHSPFLTGRNYRRNAGGASAEYPPASLAGKGRLPREHATIAEVLRGAGWSTCWVGDNCNEPADAFDLIAPRKSRSSRLGFDRVYDFLGCECDPSGGRTDGVNIASSTNLPVRGHRSASDIADDAIEFIRDVGRAQPLKPWYLWCCPSVSQAPHHAPRTYIDKYRGMFDDGYEAYREWALGRMIERGLLPVGTSLAPIGPIGDGAVAERNAPRPWGSLSAKERQRFSQMAEEYAAMSEYTDAQVGRIIDYLERSRQLDNTLIFYGAGTGSSDDASGGVDDIECFEGAPVGIGANLALLTALGSQDVAARCPAEWAAAFSSPHRVVKRSASYCGATTAPLVVHWPKGIDAQGEVRHQYHHCTDLVPSVLECCGLTMPEFVDGVKQAPLSGVSMRYSFDDASAPTAKVTQYYDLPGVKAVWHHGWMLASAQIPRSSRVGDAERQRWQLFHTDVDRAESDDLAAQYPEKVRELREIWRAEARKCDVHQQSDVAIMQFTKREDGVAAPVSGRYAFYSKSAELPAVTSSSTHGRTFKLFAEIEITGEADGVICAQESPSGGYSLFVKDGKLLFDHGFSGISPEARLECDMPGSGRHVVGVEFTKQEQGRPGESAGALTLYVDGEPMVGTPLNTMIGRFALCGEGLSIGRDGGDPLDSERDRSLSLVGAQVIKVVFDVAEEACANDEHEEAAATHG